jgi:hypothetical protein
MITGGNRNRGQNQGAPIRAADKAPSSWKAMSIIQMAGGLPAALPRRNEGRQLLCEGHPKEPKRSNLLLTDVRHFNAPHLYPDSKLLMLHDALNLTHGFEVVDAVFDDLAQILNRQLIGDI